MPKLETPNPTLVTKEHISDSTTVRDIKGLAYLPIAACLVLACAIYWHTFVDWYIYWMKDESEYSHGILVPVISLFIVWLKRKELADIQLKPSTIGYLLVIPSILVVLAFTRVGGTVIQGLTFPLMIGGMLFVLFGRRMAKELLFPVGYLYFMCVLPGNVLTAMTFRIQMWSTTGATMLLRLMSFDAYQDGAMITMSNISVQVAAPCSGFRLLISLFAFVSLFIFLKEGPRWGKASLLIITLPLSILLNSLRISMVAIVGQFYGEDVMHSFHDWSGYIMLVLAFVLLSLIARLVKCQKFNSILASS